MTLGPAVLVPLVETAVETGGSKAAALGAMLRAGLPVPDGFVVPFAVHRDVVGELAAGVLARDGPERAREAVATQPLPAPVLEALGRALEQLGHPVVAVRSSASDEDSQTTSAAGRYESFLAVRGVTGVADALRACWASLLGPRALSSRARDRGVRSRFDEPTMAVIIHRHLDAEVSGVMFTPADQHDVTVLESAWGLGPSVVAGAVTPDRYRVRANGTVTCVVADKRTRLDRIGTQLVAREVAVEHRTRATLDDATATRLAALGAEVAATPGGPHDIEWSIVDGRIWLLQARPVTAAPPSSNPPSATPASLSAMPTLTGAPGSHGTSTGTARTVRGPRDFARVRPGDILVCPFTDPAWTPLLRVAAGVVTEAGGALSHAAIVAREHGIPAVLGVPNAIASVPDGVTVTVDGAAGTVTILDT